MTEIKYNSTKINDLLKDIRSNANALNQNGSNVSSEGVSTLSTSMKYIDQHTEIEKLLIKYKKLLEKDCFDIYQTLELINETDDALSVSINSLK